MYSGFRGLQGQYEHISEQNYKWGSRQAAERGVKDFGSQDRCAWSRGSAGALPALVSPPLFPSILPNKLFGHTWGIFWNMQVLTAAVWCFSAGVKSLPKSCQCHTAPAFLCLYFISDPSGVLAAFPSSPSPFLRLFPLPLPLSLLLSLPHSQDSFQSHLCSHFPASKMQTRL